jgi:glycosyltransferase involved in cell wall biosynthesis
MKILIALASSPRHLSGVPRHAINLARCLLTRAEIAEIHLVVAPWQMGFVLEAIPLSDARLHLQAAPMGNSALSRNLWLYAQLPRLAAQLEVDIVHLAYPVPVRRGAYRSPVVVTLHDLYPYDIPENFGLPKAFFNRAVLRQCLRKVDAIACISQSTFSRLEKLDSRLSGKATVVYNSREELTQGKIETPLPEREGLPFMLCVAQHRRNKNILLALRVFERLLRTGRIPAEMGLVIVGITGPETPAIKNFVTCAGLARSVVLLAGISDAQLAWCYRSCSLVLAPSVLEGFGVPVAEALLAGCRVVCSDIPAFREFGGSHCRYVPLGRNEEDALADAIVAALSQPPPEAISFPQFSPHVIAEEYVRLYRSLLHARESNAGSHRTALQATGGRQQL